MQHFCYSQVQIQANYLRWGRSLLIICCNFIIMACASHEIHDFSPKIGAVCDEVKITGDFISTDDGGILGTGSQVWFNGVEAEHFWARTFEPDGPYEIIAIVPENATTGPIRVKISAGGASFLGLSNTDKTFEDNFQIEGDQPDAPTINSFRASMDEMSDLEGNAISWDVSGPLTSITLYGEDEDGVQVLPLIDFTDRTGFTYRPGSTLTLSPGKPKYVTLTLRASNSCVFRTSSITFKVYFASIRTPFPRIGEDSPGGGSEDDEKRESGRFQEVTSLIGSAASSCGAKNLEIETDPVGTTRDNRADFMEGGTSLFSAGFDVGLIGGAAFSPDCRNGIVVTDDPVGFTGDYLAIINRFDTDYTLTWPITVTDRFDTVLNRWQILFSPDDTIVILSSVPSVPPHDIVIRVHDMIQEKYIGGQILADCSSGSCDITAEVIGGTQIKVKLDGVEVGSFDIF